MLTEIGLSINLLIAETAGARKEEQMSRRVTIADLSKRKLYEAATRKSLNLSLNSSDGFALAKVELKTTDQGGIHKNIAYRNSSTGLNVMFSDLASLMNQADYNDEFLRPTDEMIETAWKLLSSTTQHDIVNFPEGAVYPDGDGGIRIEWSQPPRDLRLTLLNDKSRRSYIYQEDGANYSVEYDISPKTLAYWLNWLIDHDRRQ